MSKGTGSPFISGLSEHVSAESLLSLSCGNDEKP